MAAQKNHLEVCRYLVEDLGFELDVYDKNHITPLGIALHAACEDGHLPVIKFLMDHNADINKQETKNLMTPLHYAINKKHISACELILEYEAVSTQSIESGITISRISQSSEIRALLEKKLKKRRKVILV
jgi:ankyrin repeat protein